MRIAKKAAVVLCAGLMLISPGAAFQQAFGEFPATLTVKAAEAVEHNILQGNVTITDSGEHIITGTTTQYKVVISRGCTPTITIRDLTIDLSAQSSSGQIWRPIDFSSAGECKLIIEGTNIIKGGYDCPGIMTGANKLTIDGTGTLKSYGGRSWSGIGSTNGNCNLVIDGGTIYAYGGIHGAGIGGSWGHPGGTVVVNGGKVTAVGRDGASGIGGGFENRKSGGTFTINGGEVWATGSRADDISGEKYLNGGAVNGVPVPDRTVAVSYDVEPSYTVEIPATVTLSQGKETTRSISVQDVSLRKGQQVDVRLTAATPSPNDMTFHVKSNNNKLDYTIKSKNKQVKLGDNLLSVTGNGSGTAELTFTASDITFAGTYTGTLTFTISVS